MTIEVMKQALEALESTHDVGCNKTDEAISALRQAIEQAEKKQAREPKKWVEVECPLCGEMAVAHTHPVLTAPQPQQAEKQEPVAWMTINAYGEEDDIHYENPEGHLPEGWTYKPLYTNPPQARQTQDEPLGYWNAVEGWVELPEEDNKPAAWVEPEFLEHLERVNCGTAYRLPGEGRQPLYTAPQPQREWVGLTDEEIALVCAECAASAHRSDDISFARAIEAKLKDKNT
jgi:hypothetical protein